MDTLGNKISTLFKSHYAMMALCCIAMVAAFFAVSGGGGESGLFSLLAPLAACVGMHVLMFKLMGTSCHGSKEKEPTPGKSVVPDAGGAKPLAETSK